MTTKSTEPRTNPTPSQGQNPQASSASAESEPGEPSQRRLPSLDDLTLTQKIAQVLCPFFSTHRLLRDEPTGLETFVEQYGIGFIHVGKGNFPKTRRWIEHLQALAVKATGIPIAFAADCEQGLPHTFRCGNEYPWQMAIGASQSEDHARKIGALIGEEARALGIDVVFGPCVDVNTNPLNKVIATRSFGGSPELVSRLGAACVRGLQSAGVAAVLKHFPGHGTATEDSHLTLPEDPSPEALFDSIHLPPFVAGLEAGAMGVMTAHLYAPALDEANIVTVSEAIMTSLLRETLGFQGVAFTDSLNMNAVQYGRSKRKASLDALIAGCDVLVHPSQADRIEGMMTYMMQSIERGFLTEARLDQAVLQILALKEALLPMQQMPSQGAAEAMFQAPERLGQIQAVADDGVTLLSEAPYLHLGQSEQLVLNGFDELTDEDQASESEEAISLIVAVDSERKKDIPTVLPAACKAFAPQCQHFLLTEESSLLDVALYHHQISEREGPVILAVYSPMRWFKGRSMISDGLCHKLERLCEGLSIHTSVVFGSPYILLDVPGKQRLCAYGPAGPSERAVADILFGKQPPGLFLPVIWPDAAALSQNEKAA